MTDVPCTNCLQLNKEEMIEGGKKSTAQRGSQETRQESLVVKKLNWSVEQREDFFLSGGGGGGRNQLILNKRSILNVIDQQS